MPLDAIGVVVDDLDRARDFYRLLGVEIAPDPEGHGHAEAELAGGIRLMFDTVATMHEFDPEWTRAESGNPPVTFAFSCPSPADVDTTYAKLLEAGATGHKEPWDAFWGQRYAVLRDPDGNELSLYAALPDSG